MFTSENNPSRNDAKAAIIIDLYNKGLSFSQIGKQLGCSRQTCYDIARLRKEYNPRHKTARKIQFFNGVKYTQRNTGYFSSTSQPRSQMHRDVWEFYNGKIPANCDIHHKDHDRSNNTIGNLEMLTKREHTRKYHSGKKCAY